MINSLSLMAIFFTCIITVIFPIILWIILRKKNKSSYLYLFMGIVGFVVFQLCLRIPLLQWIGNQTWFILNISSNPIIYYILLAITAALFEEVGRYIIFRYVLVENRKWSNGIAYGIGHGGIEAFSIVGINYILFLLVSLHIDYGWFQHIISYIPQISAATSIVQSTGPQYFFIAGVERFFVIFIQIALSLLVLDSVRKNKISLFFIALASHFVLDFVSVLLSFNTMFAEGFIIICSIISMIYIIIKKRMWDYII